MNAPAKAAPMREDVTPGDRFRHVKRGTEYEVVGVAQLQTTDPLFDDSVMVVYRGDDGQLWTREVHEFLDRRFERLAHTARPDAGDEDVERVASAAALVEGWQREGVDRGMVEREGRTYVVQYNPNCPKPYLVRMPRFGAIDMLPAQESHDALGYGTSFAEAYDAAALEQPR
jgi:hypothetical protein